MKNVFDTIIIGAGPGGYELAANLAHKGENVAVIERGELGGTCLNRGCIPTKCLMATAEAVIKAREAEKLGVNVGEISVDFQKAVSRTCEVVASMQNGVASLLKDCTVISGEARLLPDMQVAVGDEVYKTRRIVIATGSKPALLPIEGAELALTSDEALYLDKLPESVVIIGGGVIGMEFASIFSALGVKTSVVEFCKEILPPFDPEVAKRLRMGLSRRGVDIMVGAKVEKIIRKDGCLSVCYQGKKGPAEIDAETVIMAVGRKPVVPEGCVEAGISINAKGFIEVDMNMETSVPGIYAVGDVNGLSMLAHSAYAQGRVVAESNPDLFNPYRVPSVVFTHPEVAMVGLTPQLLDNAGDTYTSQKHMYAGNGKAQASGETDGFVKFLLTQPYGVIGGISIIGAHAADLIAEATCLLDENLKPEQISAAHIHAHPTLSELFC